MTFAPGSGHGRAAGVRPDGLTAMARQALSLRSSHIRWPRRPHLVDEPSCFIRSGRATPVSNRRHDDRPLRRHGRLRADLEQAGFTVTPVK
jgi:hypothetical protein